MKLVFEFKTSYLPLDLNNLFEENKEINCHLTRNVVKEGLYIPQIRTKSYGSKSLRWQYFCLQGFLQFHASTVRDI